MSIFSRIGDFFKEKVVNPVSDFFGEVGDFISSKVGRKHEDEEDVTEEQEEGISTDDSTNEDNSTQDTGKADIDTDTEYEAEEDGLIFDFDPSLFDGIGSEDGKQYIECEYDIYLVDGEVVHGSIRFYGNEDDLTDAIIAKHGDIDSSNIAVVMPDWEYA